MTYKTLALALAVTGIAASVYVKTRRVTVNGATLSPTRKSGSGARSTAGFGTAGTGITQHMDDSGRSALLRAAGSAEGPRDVAPMSTDGLATAGIAGADSPNAGERLQETHAFGADAGISEPTADGREADDLFSSSSTSGEGPRAAGLPDLMRGA